MSRGAHIGDVLVHEGEPPEGNPYGRHSLIGRKRVEALRSFKETGAAEGYTFWYAPCHGGARRVTREEVDWETSGL